MRRITLLLVGMLALFSTTAQRKNFTYKFYGFVRGDLFYNSRANMAPIDGNFYLYPLDKSFDADGKDLNATPNGSFYTFTSRLGLDVTGPDIGKARSSAKIETDFGGFSGSNTMLRIRQAYVNLDWGKSAVFVGITWHPLFGAVMPDVLNLSTGAPFQPFNRSPQIRYRYTSGKGLQLTGAVLWQLQYLSAGPNGKSEEYIKNSCIPEVYVSADYKVDGLIAGVGMEVLSLKPRQQTTVDDRVYKVNERVTSLSFEAHAKYMTQDLVIAGKTLLASNLTQACMLGGYAVTSVDPRTGEQEYTPYRHSMTWLNIVYGKKWKPGIFVGYAKNLGTSDELVSEKLYGIGTNLDKLVTAGAELTYNVPHWKFGVEYTLSSAWYGKLDKSDGKIIDTHSVSNNRIVAVAMFMF